MFDREKLKSLKITGIEKVDCPEWAELGEVYVKGMTGRSRDTYEMSIYTEGQKGNNSYNMRAQLVVGCACNSDGSLIFKPTDADWLGEQPAVVLDRIYDVARRLSGMTAEDVDDLEKSLEAAQS